MDYVQAVAAMVADKVAVKRAGWNNEFIYHVPKNAYPAQTGVAKEYFGEGALVPYEAYIAKKTHSDEVSTYQPNYKDMGATDWEVVDLGQTNTKGSKI